MAEPLYRVVTSLLDPQQAPAAELAARSHESWEIEVARAELTTRLRGARAVLRSKTPELVRQEVWGLLPAPCAIRGLMHEAARPADEDPDQLCFSHTVHVVRRKIPQFTALSPSGQACPASSRAGGDPGRACGQWPPPPGATWGEAKDEQLPAPTPCAPADHPL